MAIERQGNQVRISGDQLASARHRGGDHLQLLDRSPEPAVNLLPWRPDHDLSWYRGHRPYRAGVKRQGNQVNRISGDQLASARHRGGDHLQLLDRSPGPAVNLLPWRPNHESRIAPPPWRSNLQYFRIR
ncbi:hypothetical protein [Aeromonas caviae]|uniref:hypothetical protein n=1 Tax=Aeromonas caviae TaxID=648 RepID=UPI002B4A1EDF|nr:hypothetical protein [Aeromonas caviae]